MTTDPGEGRPVSERGTDDRLVEADALWDDWDSPPRVPDSPELHLDGFEGALDLLLDLAERERIDLSRIPVLDMAEQFLAAMARYERHVKLERRADWLVVAARLLLLRSRLLLTNTPDAARAAQDEAEKELVRLQALQLVRAAAAWLEARPQLGRDVFTAPRRERDPRVASYMRLMEACLSVLEREEAGGQEAAEEVYRPSIPALFGVPGALARIRRRLAELAGPTPLTRFLPELPEAGPDRQLMARSAVSSTLVATLELARSNELTLSKGAAFEEVTATKPAAAENASAH